MQKQLSFHIVVQPMDGGFVATCLETGFVATDLDQDDAVSKMSKLIARTVAFAAKHDRLADIYQPASNELFTEYVCANQPVFCSSERAVRLDHCGLAIKQTAYAAALC
jgi:hypothetical protein